MLKKRLIKSLGLFFAIILCTTMVAQVENGAENYVYTPQFGNFDKLQQKGDMSIQIASGGLVNIPFPSVRFSISPIDGFGVGLNYFTFSNSNSRFDVQTTKSYVASGEVFYYGEFDNENAKVSTSYRLGAGYGAGEVNRTYNLDQVRGETNLGIQRYILEAGLLIESKNVGFGFGLRPKYYNFSNNFGFGDVDLDEVRALDYLVRTAPVFLLDLNTRFEFGGEIGRLFFSWDQTLNNIEGENDFVPGYLNKSSIHLGFYILINKAINNKNKEK